MHQSDLFCSFCTQDQLVPLLAMIESLNEKNTSTWQLTIYTDTTFVRDILEQTQHPGLSCVVLDETWDAQICALNALVEQRRLYPRRTVTFIAPEIYFWEAPWEIRKKRNRIWKSGGKVKYWSISQQNEINDFPEIVHTLQWLSVTNLPNESLEEAAMSRLNGLNGAIQAIDFTDLNLISPSALTLPDATGTTVSNIAAVTLPYVIQIQRAWIWLLSRAPNFEMERQAQPLSSRTLLIGHGQDYQRIASIFNAPGIPLQQGWHLHTQGSETTPRSIPSPQWTAPVSRCYETHFESSEKTRVSATAIVSTYNAVQYIQGCLQNLVNQSLFQENQLEIVVVDSGSEQDEQNIIRQYVERYPNIVYLRTAQREGVYRAWNRAISVARGRYITNTNTDDRHHPEALERMCDHLDNHPQTGLVYTQTYVTEVPHQTWENKTPSGVIRTPTPERNVFSKINIVGPQPMWRKDLHREVGYFDHRYLVAGDYEMWLRFAEVVPFEQIHEELGLYLRRPDSVEHRNAEHCKRETKALLWNWRHWRTHQKAS